jgi:hypothetical protein
MRIDDERLIARGLLRPFEEDGKWKVYLLDVVNPYHVSEKVFPNEAQSRAFCDRYKEASLALERRMIYGKEG